MTWTLRSRLTLSFALVALACILMVSALANGVLESSFRRYVRDSQVRQARQVVAQIGSQRTGSGWDIRNTTGLPNLCQRMANTGCQSRMRSTAVC